MFATEADLAAFKAKVRAAVLSNDLATIGGLIGVAPDAIEANRDKITMVMHKHRLEMRDTLFADRRAAFEWLKTRGHTDVRGGKLPARLADLDARP